MKQILLVRPGVMTQAQIRKMNRAGAMVIETNDFEAFRLIHAEFFIAGDAFAIAALETLEEKTTSERFASRILAEMKAVRTAREKPVEGV